MKTTIHELARLGAQARLQELQDEMKQLEAFVGGNGNVRPVKIMRRRKKRGTEAASEPVAKRDRTFDTRTGVMAVLKSHPGSRPTEVFDKLKSQTTLAAVKSMLSVLVRDGEATVVKDGAARSSKAFYSLAS